MGSSTSPTRSVAGASRPSIWIMATSAPSRTRLPSARRTLTDRRGLIPSARARRRGMTEKVAPVSTSIRTVVARPARSRTGWCMWPIRFAPSSLTLAEGPARNNSAERDASLRWTRGRRRSPAARSPQVRLACPVSQPPTRDRLRYNRLVLDRDALLAELNPPQRDAVTADDGPILVLAGAGSGKTRVIAHRIAWLLGVRGVHPRNVLAVTFTNKAAGEMARRVEELLAPVGIRAPLIATFHSACVRVLRQHIRHIGYPTHFTIYDEDDRLQLVKECMRELDMIDRTWTPALLVHRISAAKNQMVSLEQVEQAARGPREERVAALFRRYQERLAQAAAVDFDDLLLLTVRLLTEAPEGLAWYRGLWTHALVGEDQDTNRAQYRIIRQLTGEHRNVCVVGDADQCVVGGTPIETPRGVRPVEKVREGDRIVAGAGWSSARTARVEAVRRSEYDGLVVSITTDNGQELVATPNHMVFARIDPDPRRYSVYLMYQAPLR